MRHQNLEANASELQALEEEGDVYARLARSIAPEIWGHEDVKKVCHLFVAVLAPRLSLATSQDMQC